MTLTGLSVTAALITSALLLTAAPLTVAQGYDWRKHSISQSAAQGVRHAWVARAGLFLLGPGAGTQSLAAPDLAIGARVGLGVFGLAMACSALWSTRPWSGTATFDERQDRRHSLAARTAGAAYVVAVVSQMLVGLQRGQGSGTLTWLALVTAVACPLLGARVASIAGAAQRLMFGICYGWLLEHSSLADPWTV